jgi:hypothetical protein
VEKEEAELPELVYRLFEVEGGGFRATNCTLLATKEERVSNRA